MCTPNVEAYNLLPNHDSVGSRFFDIVKPRLARRMETIPGGDGILLDDVVAGLYGLVLIIVPARLLLSDLPWSVIGTS